MRSVFVTDLLPPIGLMSIGVLLGLMTIVCAIAGGLWGASPGPLLMGSIAMTAMLTIRAGRYYAMARRGASDEGAEWSYALRNAFGEVKFWGPAALVGAALSCIR